MEKRYDFAKIEKQMQDFWERERIYRFDKDAGGELYSIDTPPPTVSGSLHIGHLFSYTQAEMIARFRRMLGYNVFYPFGFDNNGLPTERLVEREEKIRANDLPYSEFVDKCRSTAAKYVSEYKEFWKSLGFSADWSVEYQTVSPEVQKISQELFLELVKTGKAYTKESPVLWCVECQTSIAQAELDTADVESAFNYILFCVDDRNSLCGDEGQQALTPPGFLNKLEIATTRPELLYGCVCLFVNPNDKRYMKYIGKMAIVPLYDYEIPILPDEKVDIEKGTGVVMCATFGDSTDAEWFAEHNLPYRKVILPNGKIAEDVPYIGGLRVNAARSVIIRLLDERGLLCKSEAVMHTVGMHERCGKPIEIIPSRQWYIDILSERERFLKAADEINWYPANMKNRYIAWVEGLKWDWCISRQRYFGVPFPVWYCKDCGRTVLKEPEKLPVNPRETEYEGVCECGCAEFVPERAVLDTWATSSVTPQINERLGLKLSRTVVEDMSNKHLHRRDSSTPMSMRTHAHEIIRTWTFYTIVRSLYHTNQIPWRDLMICGFILAKKGEKISKSKSNNDFEPKNLITSHSADVLRYWTAGARLGTDTFFSPDDLSVSKRFITKLWNAFKFSASHLQDIDLANRTGGGEEQQAVSSPGFVLGRTPKLLPADKWIIERVNETTKNAAELLCKYEIGSARHEIDELFWKDFCDNYIEIVKERLYQPDIHGIRERESGQYALYYSLFNILKLYAVYVPHITEHIYQEFFRRHERVISIHLTQWAKPLSIDTELIEFGEKLKEVISGVRKYKSERNLSMATEMETLEIHTDRRFGQWFEQTEGDLKACSRAKEINYYFE